MKSTTTTGVVSIAATGVDYIAPASHNAPQGFLLNGKISVTVASNNLTVAIKGVDGNDPSASNPVYCRIGDTVRGITAALSVTKNAGTNYFSSGSASMAANEIDYFVYLGYNATDGVVIGFARISYATKYGDFNTTSTNERYCAISTITTAAVTDYYEIIGRFAASLSATASFNWSVPTFTALNLIQRPIYDTRWLTWTAVFTGFSADPTGIVSRYKMIGNVVFIQHAETTAGTSNATGFTFSFPIATATVTNANLAFPAQGKDNGAFLTSPSLVTFGSNNTTATLYKDYSGAGWTGSGNKYITAVTFFYEI